METASWAVIAAMEPEASLVRSRLRRRQTLGMIEVGRLWRGWLGACPIALIRCGMGEERAAAALQWVVEHERPAGVLSIGFAGGLQLGLATGDVVLADRIRAWSEPAVPEDAGAEVGFVTPDARLSALAARAAQQASLSRHQGLLLSHQKLVESALDKRVLGCYTGALAVDMESYRIGSLAAAHALPFVCLRAILDPCDMELRLPLEGLTTPDGGVRPWQAAMAMVRHPRLLKSFWTLWRLSSLTRRRLAVWLDHFFALLSTILSEEEAQRL